MITNPVKAHVEEFHRRHGGECFREGDTFYYADGARRDIQGLTVEPWTPSSPENEHRLAESIVTFHRVKLNVARKEFDDWDYRLSVTAVPDDPDAAKEALDKKRWLAGVVRKCKAELAEAERKRDSTEIGRRRRDLREGEEERRQRFQDFQRKRASIRV